MNLALMAAFDPVVGISSPASFQAVAGGDPVPCRIISVKGAGLSSAFDGFDAAMAPMTGSGRRYDVPVSVIASPVKGDRFVMEETGVIWEIVQDPFHPDEDHGDQLWRCPVEKV